MLRKLFQKLSSEPQAELPDTADRVPLAVCVLLLEVARSDEEFADEERDQIVETLVRRFELSQEDAETLMATSTEERKESLDLWHFTHEVNKNCTRDEKREIITEIWRVIYADGTLDAHEDYLAHKFAKLLNLPHSELISAKMAVLQEVRDSSDTGC